METLSAAKVIPSFVKFFLKIASSPKTWNNSGIMQMNGKYGNASLSLGVSREEAGGVTARD